jgi:spermidine synthase
MSILAADGRRALAREERRYDVIEVDALYLTSGGSGNLYSVEFFELCRSRLKPGGLVCSQKPGRRVGLTFAEALPHVLDFGTIVIGSESEIPIDVATWVARLRSPAVAQRFDPETLEAIASKLATAEPGARNPTARVGFNRDLFPRDEFGTPAGW